MDMLIMIGGFIVAWVIGIGASSFLLAPPIIILMFAIPFTFEMKSESVLTSTAPAGRYTISLILLLSLFSAGAWAIWYFSGKYFWAYLIGVLLTIVPSLGKCGRTPTNITEFFESNSEYVDRDAYDRYFSS